MPSLNVVHLIGNLGKDAELRYLATGLAKAEFSLAINYGKKKPDGTWDNQTEWVNIVLFGDYADRLAQHLTKGRMVYISGRISTNSWQSDDGQKHYRTQVIADTVKILDKREGAGGGNSGGWGDGSQPVRKAPPRQSSPDIDDLPFD